MDKLYQHFKGPATAFLLTKFQVFQTQHGTQFECRILHRNIL